MGTSQPWGQAGGDGETGYPNDGHIPHGTSTIEPRTGGTRMTKALAVPHFPQLQRCCRAGEAQIAPGDSSAPPVPCC